MEQRASEDDVATRSTVEPRYGFTEAELEALIALYGRPERMDTEGTSKEEWSEFQSIFGTEVKDASLSTVIAPFFWPEGTDPDYGKANTNMRYGDSVVILVLMMCLSLDVLQILLFTL